MECPACKSSDLRIVDTIRNRTIDNKVNYNVDKRIHLCKGCGILFPVVCELFGVYVYDKHKNEKKIVTLEDFTTNYKPALGAKKQDLQRDLFDE